MIFTAIFHITFGCWFSWHVLTQARICAAKQGDVEFLLTSEETVNIITWTVFCSFAWPFLIIALFAMELHKRMVR